MNFPYRAPFQLATLVDWVARLNPSDIGMNDSQYAWYASMMKVNKRDVDGVPIRFLDAPDGREI
jgi:hypothetical protein